MDIALMAGVFAIGWFLFRWLAVDFNPSFLRCLAIKPPSKLLTAIEEPEEEQQQEEDACCSMRWRPLKQVPPQREEEEDDDEERILAAAAAGDLVRCHRLWMASSTTEALQAQLTPPLRVALTMATEASQLDAGLALAATLASEGLAEAAVAAGARLHRDAAWLLRASDLLSEAGMAKPLGLVEALARARGREGRGDLAVDMWCAQPEPALYTAALEACVATGDFASAARLARANDWQAPASASGQAAFLALARHLVRHQGAQPAQLCVAAVRRSGGYVDALTLRACLAASARSGDMVQARQLLVELAAATGVAASSPDLEAGATVVRGHCAVGQLEQALEYFRAMRQQGILPDASLFNVLLGACASRNLLAVAEELLADMEGAGVQPTGHTLAAFVRLLGARGQLSRALEVFAEFPRRHGFEPDSNAYHALVTACLAAGHVDWALDAFAKMTAAGCIASARTYEALIASCARRGELGEAAGLVVDALGLEPLLAEEPDQASTSSTAASPNQRRALVEPQVVEELLRLACRRGEAARLGLPLLARLQEGSFELSEQIVSGVRLAAEATSSSQQQQESLLPHSPSSSKQRPATSSSLRVRREARTAEWARWRNGFAR